MYNTAESSVGAGGEAGVPSGAAVSEFVLSCCCVWLLGGDQNWSLLLETKVLAEKSASGFLGISRAFEVK